MARNASGTYSLPAKNPVVTGTTIESDWANTTLADIATALTDSLSRSGDGGMLVPLQMLDGAVDGPGITFTNEPTSGLYRAAAGDVRLAILGVDALAATATGLEVAGTLEVTGKMARTSLGAVNYDNSLSGRTANFAAGADTEFTAMAADITTTGGPVIVVLRSASAIAAGSLTMTSVPVSDNPVKGYMYLYRDHVKVAKYPLNPGTSLDSSLPELWVGITSSILWDAPAAGAHTYTIGLAPSHSAGTVTVYGYMLTAYEL